MRNAIQSLSDTMMEFLPIGLNVKDKNILIVGGGRIAQRKIAALLLFSSRITVLSPRVSRQINQWALEGKLKIVRRVFYPKMINRFQIIFACTSDLKLNQKIGIMAQKKNILCNVVSNRKYSTFISSALLIKKGYIIGVSTQGESPALAVSIKERLRRWNPLYKRDNFSKN